MNVETRFGPATLTVGEHGHVYVRWPEPVVIHKVTYGGVSVQHLGPLSFEVYGDRVDRYAPPSASARAVLISEVERLSAVHVTPAALAQAARERALRRLDSAQRNLREKEVALLEALSELEAAAAALTDDVTLDTCLPSVTRHPGVLHGEGKARPCPTHSGGITNALHST